MPSTQSLSPTIITIFGITGDLAAKKILPSIWHLYKEGSLPDEFLLIGFGRKELSPEQFTALIRSSLQKADEKLTENDQLAQFIDRCTYLMGSFEDTNSYTSLKMRIRDTERVWGGCANTLFILSVPSAIYEPIFEGLASAGLQQPCGKSTEEWTRILIEKPFGTDASSAKELETAVSRYFSDEQLYLIDHYLFKELDPTIREFMTTHDLSAWDASVIERIDIFLLEKIDVGSRGKFYDAVGTLRDVGQNHMLMLLTMITDGALTHSAEDATATRTGRLRLLQTLLPWTAESLVKNTYRAQYEGYAEVEGIAQDSTTETYFTLTTGLSAPAWQKVAITLHAGKSMKADRKEIAITLRDPDASIRSLNFSITGTDEYAKVILAAIHGDQSRFVSYEEIDALWKYIDPIESAWKQNLVPLLSYPQGTTPRATPITTDEV